MNIALFFTRDGNIHLGDTYQNTEGEYSVSLKAASGFSTNFSDIRLGDYIAETVTISNDGTKETVTLNLKMPAEGPDGISIIFLTVSKILYFLKYSHHTGREKYEKNMVRYY